jgi:Zn-dependent peptidase ImmA (M78 family)
VIKREIQQKASRLLRENGFEGTAIDPIKLANQLQVRVFNAKFGDRDVHGLLATRSGRATIYVNADDPPVRKRFTIAHELGHFALHLASGDIEFIDTADSFRTAADPDADWTPTRRQEWEANVFAAALLMPEPLVRRQWPEIQDAAGMARWFQVSQLAMAIRLQELGLAAV